MKSISAMLTTAALLGATLVPATAASTTTVSGKVVDLVSYMTKDHSMNSMSHGAMAGDHAMAGGAMAGGAMAGDHAMASPAAGAMAGDHAMAGGAMAAASCPTLGLVTAAGKVYSLGTHDGDATQGELCKKLNAQVSVTGTVFSEGGSTVFLVASVK